MIKIMDKKFLNILISLAVAAILAIGAAGFFSYQMGYKKGYDTGKEDGRIAAQVKPGDAVQNPLEKMPETNPFENVANPFEDAYKNPFK